MCCNDVHYTKVFKCFITFDNMYFVYEITDKSTYTNTVTCLFWLQISERKFAK